MALQLIWWLSMNRRWWRVFSLSAELLCWVRGTPGQLIACNKQQEAGSRKPEAGSRKPEVRKWDELLFSFLYFSLVGFFLFLFIHFIMWNGKPEVTSMREMGSTLAKKKKEITRAIINCNKLIHAEPNISTRWLVNQRSMGGSCHHRSPSFNSD